MLTSTPIILQLSGIRNLASLRATSHSLPCRDLVKGAIHQIQPQRSSQERPATPDTLRNSSTARTRLDRAGRINPTPRFRPNYASSACRDRAGQFQGTIELPPPNGAITA